MLLIAVIALVITAGTVSLVDAQIKEKNGRANFIEKKNGNRSHQTEMQNIIENGSYKEWKNTINNKAQITKYINENNFNEFQKMHRLRRNGEYESAEKIMKQLGLPCKMDKQRMNNQKQFPRHCATDYHS